MSDIEDNDNEEEKGGCHQNYIEVEETLLPVTLPAETDHFEGVLNEWKDKENFRVRVFFLSLIFASLSISDFVLDSSLGIGWIFEETQVMYQTDDPSNLSTIPDECKKYCSFYELEYGQYNEQCNTTVTGEPLANSSSEHRYYPENSYVCWTTPNRAYGLLTLLITFLPGIQWYTSIKTRHKLTRVLTSLFFPVFMVLFKLGFLFHQGPKTAEMNLLVDTCETINESILQLVLQVGIILQSGSFSGTSWLQYIIITKSLIMASKGPAQEFIAARLKSPSGKEGEGMLFHEMGFKEKFPKIGLQMPFYTFLTMFRVLSICLVIVASYHSVGPFFPIAVYGVPFVVIIIIGSQRASLGKDFLAKGFRSAFTTVHIEYNSEKIYQLYWFLVNATFVTLIGVANFLGIVKVSNLGQQDFNAVLCVALSSGTLSLVIFFAQRSLKIPRKESNEDTNSQPEHSESDQLFDRALTGIKENKHPGIAFWRRLSDVVFVLFNFTLMVCDVIGTFQIHPIWSGVGLLLNFLPGLELHSYKHLGGRNQRLNWFLACLFFPFTVILFRIAGLCAYGGVELQILIIWMNGPRLQLDRMPLRALSFFQHFSLIEPVVKNHAMYIGKITNRVFTFTVDLLTAAWMTSEQIIFSRRNRSNTKKNSEKEFMNLPFFFKIREQGKLLPFTLVFVTFRLLAFALVTSCLRYHSVPLYFLLTVGAISLGRRRNPTNHSFVIRGVKSVLSLVDENYEDEAPFQVYWCFINCILVSVLAVFVNVDPRLLQTISLDAFNYFELDQVAIVRHPLFGVFDFNTFVVTILLTGILSQLLFFLMKHFKYAELPITEDDLSLKSLNKPKDETKSAPEPLLI